MVGFHSPSSIRVVKSFISVKNVDRKIKSCIVNVSRYQQLTRTICVVAVVVVVLGHLQCVSQYTKGELRSTESIKKWHS